jgi:hypothetical protein
MILRVFMVVCVAMMLFSGFGCGPEKPVQTEPQVTAPEPPPVEELRKPVAKDPTVYKALHVIKEYGHMKKKYISYEKYLKLTRGQPGGAMDPDWFYDSYVLDLNEKGHWVTVTFGTSKLAQKRDPRIQKVMADLPVQAITIKLKAPSGRTYLLSDAEADGILDFAKDAAKKDPKLDIPLLDKMQEKYTWILGLIKKHYKK